MSVPCVAKGALDHLWGAKPTDGRTNGAEKENRRTDTGASAYRRAQTRVGSRKGAIMRTDTGASVHRRAQTLVGSRKGAIMRTDTGASAYMRAYSKRLRFVPAILLAHDYGLRLIPIPRRDMLSKRRKVFMLAFMLCSPDFVGAWLWAPMGSIGASLRQDCTLGA